ncbi:MAG: portal protein, partial [Candidatus Thorarchaeota archaeon]
MATNLVTPQENTEVLGASTSRAGQTGPVGEKRFFEDVQRPAKFVGTEPAKGFSEKELADQITRQWREGSDRLRTFFDIALECWDQYRNRQDFGDKEDWQAKVTLAKAHSSVKQGVANLVRLMKQAGKFVLVEDPSGVNSSFAPHVREGVHRIWETGKFLDTSREALEAGLIMGLQVVRLDWTFEPAFKIQSDGINIQQGMVREGKLKIKAVDPWTVRFGPETRGGNDIDWIIEEQEITLPTLRKLGFEIPPDLLRDNARVDEKEIKKERRTDEREPRAPVARKVKVREYHGPVIDEDTQEVLVPNAHILLVNNQFILLAERNQLWRQKPPYVLSSPLKVVFRFPGQGLLEVNRELKKNIDAIAQMGTDYLKFSTLVMLEADMSMLENPEDLATGAEPGKIFRKRPGTGLQRALQQVPINPLQADVFNMLGAFNNEYQRGTFITDIVQGLLDTKGETTATEFAGTLTQTT